MTYPNRNHLLRTLAACLVLPVTGAVLATAPPYRVDASIPTNGITSVDIASDGSKIFLREHFGDWDEGLLVLRTGDYEELDRWSIDGVPWTFRVTADGKAVWCDLYYGGLVGLYDLETKQLLDSFDSGSWPVDMIFDVSRRYLFVGEDHPGGNSSTQGTIQVYDTWTSTRYAVQLHGQPGGSAMAKGDSYFYVVSANLASDTERLYKIDTVDFTIAGEVDLTPLGGNVGIAVSPDHDTIYVPSRVTDEIRVINSATLSVYDTINIAAPAHVSVSPSGDALFVLHDDLPYITVIDLETGDRRIIEIDSISSSWKREIVWDCDTAYVCHSDRLIVLKSGCPTDLNGDGVTDFADVLMILSNWHSCP